MDNKIMQIGCGKCSLLKKISLVPPYYPFFTASERLSAHLFLEISVIKEVRTQQFFFEEVFA